MKIIIIQSVPESLQEIKNVLQRTGFEETSRIFFTDDPGLVLDAVRENKDGSHTVVITSGTFHPTPHATELGRLNGELFAEAIMSLDEEASVYLYTSHPRPNRHVRGMIPKERGHRNLVEFLAVLAKFGSIEELQGRLSWRLVAE